MPFPIPYTNPGYTAAESAALDLLQAVTTPIVTTVIPATQSIQSPTQNIANVTAPPVIAAALQPTQSMGYIPNNIPSVAPPLVSNLVQVNPNIVDAMFQNPPYALVTRSGGGGGGGSAISSFQQLYTSSLSVSTINYTTSTIALGLNASRGTTQGEDAIAIGTFSGNNQAPGAIAIGGFSAQGGNQNVGCVAIGYDAQGMGAGDVAIAIGAGAGWDGSSVNPQPANSIVINARGTFLSTTIGSSLTIAPIRNTPSGNLSTLQYNPTTYEITYTNAIGSTAISSFQQLYTSSFTTSTIQTAPDGYVSTQIVYADSVVVAANIISDSIETSVIIPKYVNFSADMNGNDNITISGVSAPYDFLSSFNIGIGNNIASSQIIPAAGNVAIGYSDPEFSDYSCGGNQEGSNVAIGWYAGASQSTFAVAVGGGAGARISSTAHSQGCGAVAIGGKSGGFYFNTLSIPQGAFATAVGYQAQYGGSYNASLALGAFAGTTIQPPSTIIMNATGAPLNGITGQQNSLYVAPIRNTVTGTLSTLQYNPTTHEISYTNAGSGGGSTVPGGTSGSIQYNNSGAFGGDSSIQYNSGTQALTVPHFSTNTIASAALTVSSIQVKGSITGGYTTSQIDTNINIGAASYVTSPNVTIYPTDFIVGTSGTAARSISLVAGALTTGVTLLSAGAVNITAATSINLLGAGVVDISAAGGVAITGGGGVAITGGGAVAVTGGIGVSVAGGAGVVVAGGGGVAITGAGGILVGTAGGTGGGIISYGGDIGIYEGIGSAGGNGRFDNTVFASTIQVSSINYKDYNLRLGSGASGGDHAFNTGIIALGGGSYANANFAMAVGFGASTVGVDGMAIGHNSLSIGNQSIAIGREALASTMKSIAIGYSAYSMDNTVAIGYEAGSYSSINGVFIGKNTGQGAGANAIAIGSDANSLLVPAGSNRGSDTVAIGTNAMAAGSDNYSVCIGKNAGNSGVGSYVPANTIIITANQDPALSYGLGAIPGQTHSLYISPIRNTAAGNLSTLAYNPTTSEITYIPSGGGSVQISSFNDLHTSSLQVSSITTANGAFFVSGINNSNAVSGLSTLQYDPTSKQIFYTDMAGGGGNTFQDLYTSSLQVSSIQVGNRADVVGTPNKIIVFGGDSGQAGIFLSTVSGSGAGSSAGLYTNIIGSANGGNTLNITEVRTMYNAVNTMELQGVSTINYIPYHSGALTDPYTSLYASTISCSTMNAGTIGVSSFSVSSMNTYSFYAPTKCYTSTSVAGVYSPAIAGYKYLTMNLPTPVSTPLPNGTGYLITGHLNTESQTGGSGGDWSSYIKVNGNMIGVSTIMTDEGTLYGNPGSHVAISVQALFSTTGATTYPLAVDLWFQGGVGATTGDMGLVGGTLTVLANV